MSLQASAFVKKRKSTIVIHSNPCYITITHPANSNNSWGIPSKLPVTTPLVTLELSTAILKVSHSQNLEITTVEVSEGTVLASRKDSTLPPVALMAGETIEFLAAEPPPPALPPELNIESTKESNLRLSWSHSTNDWQLFESDSVSTGPWNPVPTFPTQNENIFNIVLEPEKKQKYFRLQNLLIATD